MILFVYLMLVKDVLDALFFGPRQVYTQWDGKKLFYKKSGLEYTNPIHFSSDRYIMPPPKYLVHTKLLSKENYIVLKSIWASPKHYVCCFLQLPQITTMFPVSYLALIPEKVIWTFLLSDMVCYIRFPHFFMFPQVWKSLKTESAEMPFDNIKYMKDSVV